jgi:hypothetical protein
VHVRVHARARVCVARCEVPHSPHNPAELKILADACDKGPARPESGWAVARSGAHAPLRREQDVRRLVCQQMDELRLSLTGGTNGYTVRLRELLVRGASNYTVDDIKLGSPFEAIIRMPALILDAQYTRCVSYGAPYASLSDARALLFFGRREKESLSGATAWRAEGVTEGRQGKLILSSVTSPPPPRFDLADKLRQAGGRRVSITAGIFICPDTARFDSGRIRYFEPLLRVALLVSALLSQGCSSP